MYLQYQKHHFVVEGSEYYSLHEFFAESYAEVQEHVHELGERLNGIGGIPAATFAKLAELCCFDQESERRIQRASNGRTRFGSRTSNYKITALSGLLRQKVWAIAPLAIFTRKFCCKLKKEPIISTTS